MKYDFITLVPRKNVGAIKWDIMYSAKPDAGENAVPLSVADMEFKNAPEIIEGLKAYLDRTVLGYTQGTDEYYAAVIDWCRRHHGYEPKKEHILTSPGVVPAFIKAAGCLSDGAAVTFMTPAYPPFWSAGRDNGIPVVECPLIDRGDTYDIDFDRFEAVVSRDDVGVFILCNPHNPVGRVWTRDELIRMLELCLQHNVYVIADEIHSDLIMPWAEHVSVGTLDERYLKNTVICTAPSKTFNLAGMQTSNIIVPDDELRSRLSPVGANLNSLGYEACRLAYTYGEEWLCELITVLADNYRFVCDYLAEHIPKIKPYRTEGTYLMWLDCRELGLTAEELERINIEHDLFLDEGYIFGNEGKGFERVNIACPRHVLKHALERLADAYGER